MSEELHDAIGRLHERIAQLEGRLERTVRHGTVVDDSDIDVSDPSKPRVRIQIGIDADGQPVKGPWGPYATTAGARNQHDPPSKGQQFTILSPDGDFEQAVHIPLGHSDSIQSPSTNAKDYWDVIGKTKNIQSDGNWHQEVEDASITLSKGKVVIKAGSSTWTYEDGKLTNDTKKVLFGKNATTEVSMKGTVDSGGYADEGPVSTIILTE